MQNFLDMLDNADDDWALTDIYILNINRGITTAGRGRGGGGGGGRGRGMPSSGKFLFVDHPIDDHNEREFKPLTTS